MRIESFAANADLVGRRVVLRWAFVADAGETVADQPPVTVRRKRRDFEFPAAGPGDPYLLYDSATFPPVPVPDALLVRDLPDVDSVVGADRVRERTCSVAEVRQGQPVEVLRRSVRTVFGPDRSVLRREVELLDAGGLGAELAGGVPYYYQLDSPLPLERPARLRATATAGEVHRHHRALYEMVPQIYRRHDTVTAARDPVTALLPEAATAGGQLRRFIDVFGAALDSVRSSADGLRMLRDVSEVDYRFLPMLAQWIGWDLTADEDIAQQRNEIRTAPGLYGAVGTIPGLRSVVDHYTGWSTRVAEFAQHVVRSNVAPQRNVFAAVQHAGRWCGTDETAGLLGYLPPNAVANGGAASAAVLTGSAAEPFPLRAGMTLTIGVDAGSPATITFGAADFADIGAATAAEIAEVVDSAIGECRAEATAGAVRLRSLLAGPTSRLEVVASPTSLVSLDGGPRGRPATAVDGQGRGWLAHAGTVGASGQLSRLHVKAALHGRWRDGAPVEEQPDAPAGDPAVVALPDGKLWLAWVEHPATGRSRLRCRVGVPRPFTPARIRGDASAPFRLAVGTAMRLVGHGPAEVFTVQAADYLDPAAASAAEVAAAMNAQLTGVQAAVAGDGSVSLTTAAAGPRTALRIDLAASTAARALGFGDRGLVGHGDWDTEMDWGPATDLVPVPAGTHNGCTAAMDAAGAIRLFWSTHVGGRWRLARTRWDGQTIVATSAGVRMRAADGSWSTVGAAAGLPSDDVRDAVADADGSFWFATALGAAVRTPNGTITALTAAGSGLVSDDVRAVAIAIDGSAWFATDAGASALAPDGTWSTVTPADGLGHADVRHVCADANGGLWFATAAGLSHRTPAGWRTFTIADGLPGNDVRHSAQAQDGSVWVATSTGAARVDSAGAVAAIDLSAADPAASDVRAVAAAPSGSDGRPGAVWLATAAGAVRMRSGGVDQHTVADGVPSPDCRAVLVAPDGSVWLGTTAGLVSFDGSRWLPVAGGPSGARRLHGPWTAPTWFAADGGGERDPHVLRDGARLWLASARKSSVDDPADTWRIMVRHTDHPLAVWSAPVAATTPAPAGGRTDREPVLTPLPAGAARLYFRSDRGGGPRIWTADLSPSSVAGPVSPVTTGPAGDGDPAVLTLPGLPPWLLFRSDANVALGRLGGGVPGPAEPDASRLAPGQAAVRRYAGSVTASTTDLDRNQLRRRFGDLLDYTPQRPDGTPPAPDEVYTPGTIGLYVERGPAGRPLTGRDADRLRQLLRRFLPVNLRAVIVLNSEELGEDVFDAVNPLTDSYSDAYPFAEVLPGITEQTAVALPGWLLFLSTDGTRRTVDLSDPATMRTRSWWPPPQ
ncbi:hypothetical protein ILP97_05045 [Amycolatopsis sp. H6(2020)]|nr:hypothetical protein [Amycolatopsis sp. H6(2020)]